MKKLSLLLCLLFFTILNASATSDAGTPAATAPDAAAPDAILVFSKTKGFRHKSIPAGKAALMKLGAENRFRVDTTEDASAFTLDNLKKYKTVVFLSTTGDVLDPEQQTAFEKYIQGGGGWFGIHAAADTEYDWPWYNKLAGAYFLSHPKQQNVDIMVWNQVDPTTNFLPNRWRRFDELYNYKNIQPGITVLATLDENSYEGGENGLMHPFIWKHEFEGGRAYYTGGGHTDESYVEPLFVRHLLEALKWTMGRTR